MARQFALYLLFGGLAALANLGLRFVLSRVGLAFWLAVGLAYVAGMAVNFALNKYLNFRSDERRGTDQAQTFVVVALGGLLLTEALSWLGLRLLADLPLPLATEDAAHLFAVGTVVIYSFLAHRHLTFGPGIRRTLRRQRGRW